MAASPLAEREMTVACAMLCASACCLRMDSKVAAATCRTISRTLAMAPFPVSPQARVFSTGGMIRAPISCMVRSCMPVRGWSHICLVAHGRTDGWTDGWTNGQGSFGQPNEARKGEQRDAVRATPRHKNRSFKMTRQGRNNYSRVHGWSQQEGSRKVPRAGSACQQVVR